MSAAAPEKPLIDLSGKKILITGASSGIGRETAIQAAKLGARVILAARNAEELEKTASECADAVCYPMDLTQTDQIEAFMHRVVVERGMLDGLCHSAGISTIRPLKQTKPSFLQKMLCIHICAYIELIRCICLKGNLHDGASLVGISSYAAEHGKTGQAAYAAAKAAMNGVLQPVAQEMAPRGIRINNVSFAMVRTRMYDEFLEYGQASLTQKQALGVIETKDAATAIMFLLSDASRFITGSVLPVHAGYSG